MKAPRKKIISEDYKQRLASVKKFAKSKKSKALPILLPLLKNRKAYVRNTVALALREIGCNKAVEPLIKAIKDPRNKNSRGTLLYALENLDCSNFFLFIVRLALYGNYEVQCHALNILREQSFKITRRKIEIAEGLVRKYSESSKKCEDYKLLIKELSRYLLKHKKTLL